MITSKQRSYLKSIANSIKPILQIGKNGVTDTVISQADDALKAREIIKINILNNSLLDIKETSNEIAEKLDAELVQAIGNKCILYRESEEKLINIPNK